MYEPQLLLVADKLHLEHFHSSLQLTALSIKNHAVSGQQAPATAYSKSKHLVLLLMTFFCCFQPTTGPASGSPHDNLAQLCSPPTQKSSVDVPTRITFFHSQSVHLITFIYLAILPQQFNLVKNCMSLQFREHILQLPRSSITPFFHLISTIYKLMHLAIRRLCIIQSEIQTHKRVACHLICQLLIISLSHLGNPPSQFV